MQVGDIVFVVDWGKCYSTMHKWENNQRKLMFDWNTEIPDYSGTDFNWKYEYEPNLTLKGTVNKREPKKLKSKTPIYKEYRYEVLEMIQHPTQHDKTICLLASIHGEMRVRKCFTQVELAGLSYMTPEQYADSTWNALKEFHKGKYSIHNYKGFPEELMYKIYDKDDSVLFGSGYTKGKVYYSCIDGFYTVDGIPFIVGSHISYDGTGNADLPEGTIFMSFNDLAKVFTNNSFR